MQQLLGGYIDRNRNGNSAIHPLAQLSACGTHDPAAHVDDQASFFRYLDETVRRDIAMLRVTPAQ
jgi:hypothetical protein